MSARDLVAVLWGTEAGRVTADRNGRYRFAYDDAWRRRTDAVPLSLSMPLAATEHPHKPVSAYLWGLLPDNEVVLQRWSRRFQVSARNAFALLAHVGEDCAGAVQFVLPERLEAVVGEGPVEVEWLAEHDIAQRLRLLREDQGAWRSPSDTGQFSLAGAQPKTALLFDGSRYGVPQGRTPTTHILKPPIRDRPGHVENEHLCMSLARALGLPTALSEVRRFEDEVAIVVTRYDRLRAGDSVLAGVMGGVALAHEPGIVRLHQEDTCQSLAVPPTSKYQSDGGPSPLAIVGLLRDHSSDPGADVETFVDALAFNWLVAGTDAHAKNYSVLIAAGGQVRLAPLYDLASALPYPGLDTPRLRLAMKIGSKYRLAEIQARHWHALWKSLGIDEDAALSRMKAMAERLPAMVGDLGKGMRADGLDARVLAPLVKRLADRARACAKLLETGA
jgi:serine/threonine-protein kinase HipA